MTPTQFNELQRQADVIERNKQYMKKRQTPVEWLYEQIGDHAPREYAGQVASYLEEAMKMEQEYHKPIKLPSYDNVTRFEVIDYKNNNKGRILVQYNVRVEVSIQDEGRTMKVFLIDQNK